MDNLQKFFTEVLRQNEQIKWTGQPKKGLMLRSSDFLFIPFSLMWGGFAIFWEYTVVSKVGSAGPGVFFALWGIPFVMVGLYLIVGRFFVDKLIRDKTYYAVTNQRILIKKAFIKNMITGIELSALPPYTLTIHKDKRGTIAFGSDSDSAFGGGNFSRGMRKPPMFEFIENPQKVTSLFKG